jgi:MoaA/NifB/PqqE/SkfB family radical SAM enzyme
MQPKMHPGKDLNKIAAYRRGRYLLMTTDLFLENKALNRKEIQDKKVVLDSKVTSLVVTLTTKCNISCIMCEEKTIPWDMPERVLEEITGLFPFLEEIIWQGGEVMILDYFRGLVEEANKFPNLHQSIITNGVSITEELAPKVVKDNIELTFSIDATEKGLYETIRRKAKFEDLIRSIKLINRLRKEKDLKNMSFRMHAVVMKANYKRLEGFIDFAKEHEFDALHLMPIWGNLESRENIFYQNDREALDFIQANIVKIEKKARDCGLNLLNSLPFRRDIKEECLPSQPAIEKKESANERLICYMPWKRMVINPAGNVCPACHCRQMVGNVIESSLAQIWNNEKMQDYRKKLSDMEYHKLCGEHCVNGTISEELRGLK